MTRSELIKKLAAKFPQLTHNDVELAVTSILDRMSDYIARNDRIEIRGFGAFSLNYRPPRNGRNPKSGEKVAIPAKYAPHFKPGKDMKALVNQ